MNSIKHKIVNSWSVKLPYCYDPRDLKYKFDKMYNLEEGHWFPRIFIRHQKNKLHHKFKNKPNPIRDFS